MNLRAADGFPWVEEYSIGLKTDYVQQTAALTCQIWSYAQILRYLVKTEQTGLIISDDKTGNTYGLGTRGEYSLCEFT